MEPVLRLFSEGSNRVLLKLREKQLDLQRKLPSNKFLLAGHLEDSPNPIFVKRTCREICPKGSRSFHREVGLPRAERPTNGRWLESTLLLQRKPELWEKWGDHLRVCLVVSL